jgi:hypothetical protein
MKPDRRTLLGSIAVLLTPSGRCAFGASTPADFERRLALIMKQEKLFGLHALLVSQHDKIIFEHYQPGEDEDRSGKQLGVVTFAPDVAHDLRSVTKGVVFMV